jgi:S1-C subfamily serine protease
MGPNPHPRGLLADAIADLRADDTVAIEYVRDGERRTVEVRLTAAG